MLQPFDASKSLTAFEQDSTIVAVIEMSRIANSAGEKSQYQFPRVVVGMPSAGLPKLGHDRGRYTATLCCADVGLDQMPSADTSGLRSPTVAPDERGRGGRSRSARRRPRYGAAQACAPVL